MHSYTAAIITPPFDGLPFWKIHVIAVPFRERVALIMWNGQACQDIRFVQPHSGVPCSTRVGKKDNPSRTKRLDAQMQDFVWSKR